MRAKGEIGNGACEKHSSLRTWFGARIPHTWKEKKHSSFRLAGTTGRKPELPERYRRENQISAFITYTYDRINHLVSLS